MYKYTAVDHDNRPTMTAKRVDSVKNSIKV